MSGNVAEWCQNGSEYKKRIRGGAFNSFGSERTISYSSAASKDFKSENIGLRLLLKPIEL